MITFPSSHLSPHVHLSVPSIQIYISVPSRGLGNTAAPQAPWRCLGIVCLLALHAAGLWWPPRPLPCFQNSAMGQDQRLLLGPQGPPVLSANCPSPAPWATSQQTSGLGLRSPLLTIQAAGGLKLPLNAGNLKGAIISLRTNLYWAGMSSWGLSPQLPL